jgi:hypothetical protein
VVTCARCGVTVDDPPPTWSRQSSGGRDEWLCERCTRENVRAIEGRLDAEWW